MAPGFAAFKQPPVRRMADEEAAAEQRMVAELEQDLEVEGAPGEGELGVGKVKAATADTQKRLEVRASPSPPHIPPLRLIPPPPPTHTPHLYPFRAYRA